MKLSYNPQIGYVISQLGTVIDASNNLNDLLTRNGIMEDETESGFTPFDEAEGNDYDADLDLLLGDLLGTN